MCRSVELLVEERPEVVLIAGDFVYGPSDDEDEDIRKVKEFVRPLTEAGLPTYAVLGNHDYRIAWPDVPPNPAAADRVRAALEVEGVGVLKNEAVALEPLPDDDQSSTTAGDESLHLIGIGVRWPNEDRPDTALSEVPNGAPRFVIIQVPSGLSPRIPRPWRWRDTPTAGRCACRVRSSGPGWLTSRSTTST